MDFTITVDNVDINIYFIQSFDCIMNYHYFDCITEMYCQIIYIANAIKMTLTLRLALIYNVDIHTLSFQ